jgi:hypothetical protein
MRPYLVVLVFLYGFRGFAQELPPFRPLRYDEDYASLKNDSPATWYSRIKYAPLSKKSGTYISLGGEARFQYFYVKNEGWGDVPEDKNGYVLSRYLFHADLHAGKHVRTFAQVQSSLSGSRTDPGPVDDNPLELHQAFADVQTNNPAGATLVVRLGRQELLYGSQRLISVREGPNNRQSFDAARAIVVSGNYRMDLFYSHYVAAKKDIFNDGFNKHTKLWGAYATWRNRPVLRNADYYYLGLWKRHAVFDDGQGKEVRHSIGSRIWKHDGNCQYDVEALYQFGTFAGKTIAAWTASINVSYTFSNTRLQPVIGLKTELISGDKRYDDDRLQTFNPLFPRGAYFGLAALVGPANLTDVHPSLTLTWTKQLEMTVDYDLFWRYSRHDGLYGVNGSLIYSGRNISGKFVGGQPAIHFSWAVSHFLHVTIEGTWFYAGDFLQAAGAGKDIVFTGITTQLKL